jgi:mannosylglycoprotein endo-beta-mannosidase
LEQPITYYEFLSALRSGARHKSPGIDGLSLEFYTSNWETIHSGLLLLLKHMFLHKHISHKQKHGIVGCLHKTSGPHTPHDNRPVSLLTTKYKLLARILARRLQHILATQLQNSQFCGILRNSILDAISYVRYVLAHVEATGTLLYVLISDFRQAFDRIYHQYLFRILRSYGIIH